MTKFKINPQTGYIVSAALDFANYNSDTFVNYYLPLMSPVAMGLFSTLQEHLHSHPLASDRRPVSSLLTQVNMGINDLDEAVAQLEAVGLIKSFYHHDEMGDIVVFELHPTLIPAQFIQDELLSIQLLQMVGPENFKKLSQQASETYFNVDDYQNISHQFFEVFHPDQNEQSQDDPAIRYAQDSIKQLTSHRVDQQQIPNDTHFDWHFLAQQLAGAGVDTDIVQENRQLILAEHQTYGYDEMAIARLIQRAVNVVDNQFDAEQFKIYARQADSQTVRVPQQNQHHEPTVISNLDLSGLSAEVQELLKQCETQAPMEFLHQLKQQTGGYVTSAERRVVERIVNQGRLSNGAINLLLWYIIGEQGLATVKTNLADAIANNWIRAGVHNSVDAWHEIQRHQQDRLDRQSSQHRSYSRKRGQVKEKLPDWAKKGHQTEYKKASAEQIAKSKRALAELRAMRKKRQQDGGDN